MEYASEMRIKSTHYILTGFSIVVGLAWNEFVKKLIDKMFPINSETLLARLFYCIFVTFILIVVIKYLPATDKELPKFVQKKLAPTYIPSQEQVPASRPLNQMFI